MIKIQKYQRQLEIATNIYTEMLTGARIYDHHGYKRWLERAFQLEKQIEKLRS